MFIIGLSFFTVLGILSAEYYERQIAIQNGLQECVVMVDDTAIAEIWAKDCN